MDQQRICPRDKFQVPLGIRRMLYLWWKSVRGLCIATGQYSSFCVSAVVLFFGDSNVVGRWGGHRTSRQWERERETREGEEEDKTRTENERSNMSWHVHEWFCQTHVATFWATMWCVHQVAVECKRSQLSHKEIRTIQKLWGHFHFHSDLSHHDVFGDECHRLRWSWWRRSSICSIDSWYKRFSSRQRL